MAASFILNTRAELMKSKRTASIWLAVIGALFVPLVNFIGMMADPEHFVKGVAKNGWVHIIEQNWTIGGLFILPCFVILSSSLLVQIEYRNNTWKQVYASPRSYADIFFSKLIVIHLFAICCFLLFNCFIVGIGYLAVLFNRDYQAFLQPVPWDLLFTHFAKAYFGILTMTIAQYWMALRFRNFIVPMAIGLALLITGLMLHGWDKIYYYPYIYPAVIATREFENKPEVIEQAKLFNVIWFVILLGLCYLDTIRRKERG